MQSFSKEDIKKAYLAGYNRAQNDAEISEWDGWHKHDPLIEWPSYMKREEGADEYTNSAKPSA